MRQIFIFLAVSTVIATQSSSLHDVANDSANIVTKILGSFQGTSSMNLTQFFSTFDVPSCLRRCMPALDNVGILLDVAKNPDFMKGMCRDLTEASKCATSAGCDGTFVGAISNAFQFVCLDNLEKVSTQIACIQESAGDLQQECEAECAIQADVLDKAAKNSADQLFNMEKLCNSTNCITNCYQENLHKYCDIGDDNVLDTIFSQFETLQEKHSTFGYKLEEKQNKTGVAKLFGLMLPEECTSEKIKIKIPKKIDITTKPKSVGSPPDIRNDLLNQKKSLTGSQNNSPQSESDSALLAKSGNLSSAALLYKGKIQTLQCQFLDSHGKPQNTPDFETLSEILSKHFNKQEQKTTLKPPVVNETMKKKLMCHETSSEEPQSRNLGSVAIVFTTFAVAALTIF